MSEVAEKAAEVTAEVVEESIDGVIDTIEVVRNNPKVLVVVGVLGVVAGGVGGYFIARKKLRTHYEQIVAEEIADAKEFYSGVYKVDETGASVSPQSVLEARHGAEAAEALRTYQGGPSDYVAEGEPHDDVIDERQIQKLEAEAKAKEARIHSTSLVAEKPDPSVGVHPVEIVETETRSVWDAPTFDYNEEVKYRTEDKPYIITHDEYFAAEKGYETSTLTYYEADDTLTDENDQPIREVDKVIGDDHLVRFGTASQDKNIVYIRNDRLELDYEVVKSTGSYVEEVLGMLDAASDEPNSLKHANRHAQQARRRAFRHGDG